MGGKEKQFEVPSKSINSIKVTSRKDSIRRRRKNSIISNWVIETYDVFLNHDDAEQKKV